MRKFARQYRYIARFDLLNNNSLFRTVTVQKTLATFSVYVDVELAIAYVEGRSNMQKSIESSTPGSESTDLVPFTDK
jgi:hypothetical protein